MVSMSTSVVGVDDLNRRLDGLAARSKDLRPVLVEVADDFRRSESSLFASRGASVAEPWAASRSGSPVTMEGRRAKLRRSLTVERANRSIRRITRTSVTLGSSHPLAHLHQGGTGPRYAKTYKGKPLATPRFAGSLPRRVVFHVGETDIARWRGMIASYVTAETSRIGL